MSVGDMILYRYLLTRIVVRERIEALLERIEAPLLKGEEGASEVTWLLILFGAMGVILLVFAIFNAATNKGRVVLGQIEGLRQSYP